VRTENTSISLADEKQVVREHFDRLSVTGDWSRLYTVTDSLSYHFHIRRLRVLELLPERLGRVADIGCGPGIMVEAVLKRGGTFDGVDLSLEMLREAAARFGRDSRVSFRQDDVERLSLLSNAHDQVICMAVLEYLKSPDQALAEIARILCPGGVAVVTVPKQWHIDSVALAVTAPIRAAARAMGWGRADRLPRLRLQPQALDKAARRAGLIPDGGSQYCFTPLPYPLTRLAPALCMRCNVYFERFHQTRWAWLSFFAHGYVGRYRKPLT